jgi:hypothetical protein
MLAVIPVFGVNHKLKLAALSGPKKDCVRFRRPFESRISPNSFIVTIVLLVLCCFTASARDFYASPSGKPGATGSLNNPWDLQTALSQTQRVRPGDTVLLRGGTYNGAATNGFNCTLAGNSAAPIVVRNYPGERAIIDRGGTDPTQQAALDLLAPYVTLWGLEIMNSYPDRNRISPYTGTVHGWRGPGIYVSPGATDCKIINCIIHDNNSGIYDKEDRTEIYGNLIYYNGNNAFAHGIYIGNDHDTKYVVDNLIFDNAGLGIQSYSANNKSQQKGIYIEGNACFNNGAITLDDQNSTNILVGAETGVAAERVTVISNYIYDPQGTAPNKSKGLRLGQVDQNNKDAVIRDNYIACKVPLTVQWWNHIEMRRNTIYTPMTSVSLKMPAGVTTTTYDWDKNTYINGRNGEPVFSVDSTSGLTLSSWRQRTMLDQNSHIIRDSALRPKGVQVFVRPNKYELGRGQIIVFNWDLAGSVTVDLINVCLDLGDAYEVRDAQNYFGAPIARGIYDGKTIKLPMRLSQVANPIGSVERLPVHTAPEFAAFIVQKRKP